MSELHFLNVKNGDCSWIKHNNGNNSIIDVNNASKIIEESKSFGKLSDLILETQLKSVSGNFNQKNYPVNPIEYLTKFNVKSVFRFILTHPDMDHMGGIKDFFSVFSPTNFWDTDNNKEMGSFDGSPYSEDDWKFYKKLRNGSDSNPKRLVLYHGAQGQYFNKNEDNTNGGNGLYILAPSKKIIEEANETGEYNDCSYVILYRASNNTKTILAGDSHDKTWSFILENYENDVKNVDLLIAPHHGRASNRSNDFLDVLKPKLTFFGNANSEHLAYADWNNRKLEKITNNQGNCLIADYLQNGIHIYCTYKKFAEVYTQENGYKTFFSEKLQAWFLKII